MELRRRSFLATLGAGLVVGLPDEASAAKTSADTIEQAFSPNVFVHVAEDGQVTVVCHRSEMGQGVRTSLAYLFADEIGVDAAKVRIVQADGDAAYGDQNTDGSSSIRKRYDELRRMAAVAREALVGAAAKQLRVRASSLEVRDGAVHHAPTKRSLGFGELVGAAAKAPLPDPSEVPLRPDGELGYLKRDLPHLDAPLFATGGATYAADVKVPGMLVAVIARPPVLGSEVKRFDAEAAKAIPGVRHVIEMPTPSAPYAFQTWGGVAVVADHTWAAMRGRDALAVEWTDSEHASYDTDTFKKAMQRTVRSPGEPRRQKGDVDAAFGQAAKAIDAEYFVPHLPHAPMEPPAALARVEGSTVEIWACTQAPQAARRTVAQALGVAEDDVVVHVTFLGGAFGRKSKADFVVEAAWLAKEVGAPVRVQWTREDDVRHDYYNAVSLQKLTAGMDAEGNVIAWRHRTCFPPIATTFNPTATTPSARDLQQGVLDLALAVPNVRAEGCPAPPHVRVGWLRSVYNIFHAFAVQSFACELARHQGKDPADALLDLIGPPRELSLADLGIADLSNYGADLDTHPVDAGRLRRVIERVTAACDWEAQRSKGRALGLAAHRSFLAYVAVVASMREGERGRAVVDEVWVTLDAGRVVHRDRVRSQIEGSVIFGMTLALKGGVPFAKGVPQRSNFHDLRLLRMPEAPRAIHVDIIPSDAPPAGVGEPGVPPVAPAIANALWELRGDRQRELPLDLGPRG